MRRRRDTRATPKSSQAELLKGARSWVGKLVKDTRERTFGLVIDVDDANGGTPTLLVRFPGEEELRVIALEPVSDGEYLYPNDIEARYRPPNARDEAHLKMLAARRKARS